MKIMDEDKKKICEWIMDMDVDAFYDLCICLTEGFEFTGNQLFYSCQECEKEHSEECNGCLEKCKEFFVKHYTGDEAAGAEHEKERI